jgi:hypothetical protein
MSGGPVDGAGVGEGPRPDLERAEYASGAGAGRCEACQGALAGSYYQVNGHVVCVTCRGRAAEPGSDLPRRERIIMATVYGGGAALLGSLVWYAVARITGMELGIIAIGIGLLVGLGVKKGSRARGGRGYQALAMVLTYFSIVTSYVPTVVSTLVKQADEKHAADPNAATAAPSQTASAPKAAAPAAPTADAKASKKASNMNPVLALVLFSVIVLGIAAAAPFLTGASNFMGWLIIAIALYEAWKINRRMALTVVGPFQLAPQPETPEGSPSVGVESSVP